MLLRALRVTARRAAPRRLSTPTAASPEAVCANIGVDHHEGALDQVFATLDQNGDGKIDPKELKTGLAAAGLELTDKALQRLTETYGDSTGCLKLCGNQPVRRVHFSATTRPSWLGRPLRKRHRHAIEQASRRWRGGGRDDSARRRRDRLIHAPPRTQKAYHETRRESGA